MLLADLLPFTCTSHSLVRSHTTTQAHTVFVPPFAHAQRACTTSNDLTAEVCAGYGRWHCGFVVRSVSCRRRVHIVKRDAHTHARVSVCAQRSNFWVRRREHREDKKETSIRTHRNVIWLVRSHQHSRVCTAGHTTHIGSGKYYTNFYCVCALPRNEWRLETKRPSSNSRSIGNSVTGVVSSSSSSRFPRSVLCVFFSHFSRCSKCLISLASIADDGIVALLLFLTLAKAWTHASNGRIV